MFRLGFNIFIINHKLYSFFKILVIKYFQFKAFDAGIELAINIILSKTKEYITNQLIINKNN